MRTLILSAVSLSILASPLMGSAGVIGTQRYEHEITIRKDPNEAMAEGVGNLLGLGIGAIIKHQRNKKMEKYLQYQKDLFHALVSEYNPEKHSECVLKVLGSDLEPQNKEVTIIVFSDLYNKYKEEQKEKDTFKYWIKQKADLTGETFNSLIEKIKSFIRDIFMKCKSIFANKENEGSGETE